MRARVLPVTLPRCLTPRLCRLCSKRGTPEEQQRRRRTLYTLFINIAVVVAMSFLPFVDWGAHIGGLVGGAIASAAIFADRLSAAEARSRLRWTAVAAYGVLLLTLLALALAADDPPEGLGNLCEEVKASYPDHECL